jgi:predicted nucleotidyltransferase
MAGLEAPPLDTSKIREIAKRHGATNLRVFGSFARGDAHANSDLDLLVDMPPESSLLDMVALTQDLEEAIGRRVDVLTEAALHRLLRERILLEARPL